MNSHNLDSEIHPLGFFLPPYTQLLMLGSFPPPKSRWSMDFYYPNFQNDMWRILGLIFYDDASYFIVAGAKAFDVQKAKEFCIQKGIGIGDVAEEIIRLQGNASDATLQIVKPFDILKVLEQTPECRTIVVTGQKAMEVLLSVLNFTEPKIGEGAELFLQDRNNTIKIYRMPSTSRAYPKPLKEKAKVYESMFREVGL